MDNELRTFTIAEANQMLQPLTQLVRALQEKQRHALDSEVQIDALELVADQKNKKAIEEVNRLVKTHHDRVTEFYALIDQIHQRGCLLKDVDTGLIDFYSVIDGKVVYLCWRLGEEEIGYWHEVGKGYAFRHPLNVSPNDVHDSETEDRES